jgi:hypothetical protein
MDSEFSIDTLERFVIWWIGALADCHGTSFWLIRNNQEMPQSFD